ncbi:NepR family anti-sigma factor [Microvirga yunnanensis]|uniref:NepR family anti-sigma factor n=1 Tax=Microvirga yunnanensis TaxID=2953740 RepID=UPI0021C7347B|nr:NepR family anti-sigma factor [Microvirga sp. HBU65207]
MLTPWPEVRKATAGERHQLEGAQGEPPPEPTLFTGVAACLGERLRAHYAQLMNEPVPDDLLRILEALGPTGRAGDGH